MFNRHKIAQTRMTGANRAIVLSLVLTLGSGGLAAAQTVELKTLEPGAKRDNPKARALFDQVAGAYKALKSYSDKGEFILAFKVGDKLEKQVLPMKMTFACYMTLTWAALPFLPADGINWRTVRSVH